MRKLNRFESYFINKTTLCLLFYIGAFLTGKAQNKKYNVEYNYSYDLSDKIDIHPDSSFLEKSREKNGGELSVKDLNSLLRYFPLGIQMKYTIYLQADHLSTTVRYKQQNDASVQIINRSAIDTFIYKNNKWYKKSKRKADNITPVINYDFTQTKKIMGFNCFRASYKDEVAKQTIRLWVTKELPKEINPVTGLCNMKYAVLELGTSDNKMICTVRKIEKK